LIESPLPFSHWIERDRNDSLKNSLLETLVLKSSHNQLSQQFFETLIATIFVSRQQLFGETLIT
jgi:hypothetical protein